MIVLHNLIVCLVLASITVNDAQAGRGGGGGSINRHSSGSVMRHPKTIQHGGGSRGHSSHRNNSHRTKSHTHSNSSRPNVSRSKSGVSHPTASKTSGRNSKSASSKSGKASRSERGGRGRNVVHNHYHYNHFGLWWGVPGLAWWSPYAAFWGPYVPYTFFGLAFTFYPTYGLWYSRPWGAWMYPGGLWFDPRLGAWYSLWSYSLYWHTAYTEDNRPYVVIDNSGSKTLWGAVYERNGNTLTQVEAPRKISGKRQENLFLKNRSDNQVIIMAQKESDLPSELADKDLGDQHQVIRYNTQSVAKVKGDPDQAAKEFDARIQERKAAMKKVAPKLTSSPSKEDSDKTEE